MIAYLHHESLEVIGHPQPIKPHSRDLIQINNLCGCRESAVFFDMKRNFFSSCDLRFNDPEGFFFLVISWKRAILLNSHSPLTTENMYIQFMLSWPPRTANFFGGCRYIITWKGNFERISIFADAALTDDSNPRERRMHDVKLHRS